MKNLLFIICLMIGTALSLQAQADYMQWESHRFRVKPGQTEEFEKGLAAHHKKFHNAAPYKTGVYKILTGPNTGEYELDLGPMTFTQMGERPSGEAHDADWAKVMEHAESSGETVYWRADKDVDYSPEGTKDFTVFRWRYSTILPGQGDRYEELMEKIAAVAKAKNYGSSFRMYWRYGASQGPHVCTELGMNSLAYLDEKSTFWKDYEEVHGTGSVSRFWEELDLCVDRAKTYDELVKLRLDLSSDF